jgi:hypothetical protein
MVVVKVKETSIQTKRVLDALHLTAELSLINQNSPDVSQSQNHVHYWKPQRQKI